MGDYIGLENRLKAISESIRYLADAIKAPEKVQANVQTSLQESQNADLRESHQVDPRNGIFLKDGKYHVWVNIQDGYENCGVYDSPEEATKQWFSAQKILNGNTPERLGPAVIYEAIPVPEVTYKYRKVN